MFLFKNNKDHFLKLESLVCFGIFSSCFLFLCCLLIEDEICSDFHMSGNTSGHSSDFSISTTLFETVTFLHFSHSSDSSDNSDICPLHHPTLLLGNSVSTD